MPASQRNTEVQIGVLIERIDAVLEKMDAHMQQTALIEQRLNNLEVDYNKYKSFFGGILFVLSALWMFMVFAWQNLRNALKHWLNLN